MYYRDRESNLKAAIAYNQQQRANARDRLKLVAVKRKVKKAAA